MKLVLPGISVFLLGGAAAMGIRIFQSRARPQFEMVWPQSKDNFELTQFSLEEAPNQSIKGQITDMAGEIWKQDRVATEPAKLNQPGMVQQGEILIASDEGKLTVEFNPAVTMTLYPQTTTEIVQTLPVNLVFNQTKGVGQYLAAGTNPVTIRSLNLIVNLDEGLLVVDTDGETGTIKLGLKTGTAKVGYNSPEFDSRVWELSPGDVFEYDSSTRRGYFK